MGIRYYAYAFDADATEHAVADPRAFIGADPLADAWGLVPAGDQVFAMGPPALPPEDFLYLDKAWPHLQALSAPTPGSGRLRPAYRMFEGQVTMEGYGWTPWVRAIRPEEVAAIAHDVAELMRAQRTESLDGWVGDYLADAARFTAHQAAHHRGFAYLIG